MKIKTINSFKYKSASKLLLAFVAAFLAYSMPAYSQIDYNFGLNKKGFRLNFGLGASKLDTHWPTNGTSYAVLAGLDYDFSPYFSIGTQADYVNLNGQDTKNVFSASKVDFFAYQQNINFKLAAGVFAKTESQSKLTDILRRFYIGAGVGFAYSSGNLYQDPNGLDLTTVKSTTHINSTGHYVFTNTTPVWLINFGTNIDLPGFLGADKIEINPNFEYVKAIGSDGVFFDGYRPAPTSSAGGYSVYSVAVRYKF